MYLHVLFGPVCVPVEFEFLHVDVWPVHLSFLSTLTMDPPVAARRRTAGASTHSGSSQVSDEPEERYVSTYNQVRVSAFASTRSCSFS